MILIYVKIRHFLDQPKHFLRTCCFPINRRLEYKRCEISANCSEVSTVKDSH